MYSFRILTNVVGVRYLPSATSIIGSAMASSSNPEPFRKKPSSQIHVGSEETYENAIKLLNTLQSNARTLDLAKQNQEQRKLLNIPNTIGALETAGVTMDLLDNLDIIHVAGTKGKGMTCAFTECMLRKAGLKTGFFSSPHLTSVRERIRINGEPLSKNAFTKHFFTIFHRLKKLQEPNSPYEMPPYFRFLTIMAFHVFVEEEVDAVILEVGIGGRYCNTNAIRKPIVNGISALGLDHQSILGNTLEEIALDKAGIMKKGIPAYTVSTHPPNITDILRSNADSVECPLHCVNPLDIMNTSTKLGVDDGFVARQNAGLAVHLANEFLLQRHPHLLPGLSADIKNATQLKYSNPENFLPFHKEGLECTKWEGRFQVINLTQQITFFLDGAHTVESVPVAAQWFKEKSAESSFRVLIFNLTKSRSSNTLLEPLANKDIFDLAVFCPFISSEKKRILDNWSALDEGKDHLGECQQHVEVWENLQVKSRGIVCSSAESTVEYIKKLVEQDSNSNSQSSVSVLVTGSVHLVGKFLAVLDPSRDDSE